MAAIKTVADSLGWFYVLTTVPANLGDIKLAALTAGPGVIDGSKLAAASGTRFAHTASDATADPAYGESSNAQVAGRSNYEGSIAPFIKVDEATGAYTAADNTLFAAILGLAESHAEFCVISGITGDPKKARAAGDLYEAFVYTADKGSAPTEVGGWKKFNFPLLPAGRSQAPTALKAA